MAKTGHPNFVIDYQCQWRGIQKIWSITSNHSGATLSLAQALVFVQAVDSIVKSFIAPMATNVFVARYAYYDGQNSAPLLEADYSDQSESEAAGWTAHSLYGSAYIVGAVGVCGAETCTVLQAPVGQSKTNKPVLLRHWVHNVPPSQSAETDDPPFAAGAADIAAQLGDGSLPGNRVLISASGKQGAWVTSPYFGAHKMSKRWKRSTGSSILDVAADLNKLRTALADSPELA